jgi:phosphate starvation-inducible membrane PsiE
MPRLPHSPSLDLLLIVNFILLFSSLLGPNILLRTLFTNTLSLCSSLNATDQVSHPYKTTGRIMVFLYFNLYEFLDSKRQDKKKLWTEW